MNRRDIFKMMGLSPVILPAVVYAQSKEGNEPERNILTLQTMNGLGLWENNEPNMRVDMSIGKDGHLWLKSDKDQWKRVVTE